MRLDYVPNDGYTEQGFVAANPRIHGEVRFRYRPMIAFERSRLLRQFQGIKAEEADSKLAEVLKKHVLEWDLKDAKGNSLPISADTIGRLKPALLYRLQAIIMGTEASDLDPQWETEERTEVVSDLLEASDGPAPIGQVREDRQEKNSVAG